MSDLINLIIEPHTSRTDNEAFNRYDSCIYLFFFFRLEDYKLKSETIEQELLECQAKMKKLTALADESR